MYLLRHSRLRTLETQVASTVEYFHVDLMNASIETFLAKKVIRPVLLALWNFTGMNLQYFDYFREGLWDTIHVDAPTSCRE